MRKITQESKAIKRYIKKYKACLKGNTWIEYCLQQKTLKDAIRCAALARDDLGKKNGHQRRLRNSDLTSFADNLMSREDEIANAETFENLLDIVKECKVKGVGELAFYDTALRIGGKLKLTPDYIYLHAGTKKGAERLLGKKLPDKFITKKDLPEAFQCNELTPAEIEDILCLCKDGFDEPKDCNIVNTVKSCQ